jgi:hypothetical protein
VVPLSGCGWWRGRAGVAPRPPALLGLQDCTTQIDSGAFQYITTIENRRVLIADETTGLAVGLSHFRHPMTQKQFSDHRQSEPRDLRHE